ncbi:MAG TPA: YetF domain-containing protein [Symbiobacteriaceae bacterium]|nr:YetF domain-containing protein [Symbiobacteriaceae bacterium]
MTWQKFALIWTDTDGNVYHIMLTLFLRTLITYIVVLSVVRFSGKRAIANLAPFDLAMVILIGEVSALPVAGLEPLYKGLLPAALLGAFHMLTTYISVRNQKFEKFTEGVPTQLVKDGKVIQKALKKERVSMDDLLTALRLAQVTDVSTVKEAYLEHAGGISVILKKPEQPVTAQQLEHKLNAAIEEIVHRGAQQLHREVMQLLEQERNRN